MHLSIRPLHLAPSLAATPPSVALLAALTVFSACTPSTPDDGGPARDDGGPVPRDGGPDAPDAGNGDGNGDGDGDGDGENTTAACTDGVDNDGDPYVDCEDFDCSAVWPCSVPETNLDGCTDGYDNDGDGYIDCDDFDCDAFHPQCEPDETDQATCTDGVDNDDDGQADCADAACAAQDFCSDTEGDEATCTDGVDNDNDGARDCLDDACADTAACNLPRVRVMTWNLGGLGAPGTPAFDRLVDVAQRIAPDILCFQEVLPSEDESLATLAELLGFGFHYRGFGSSLAGAIRNACMTRLNVLSFETLLSDDISPDPSAREIGRGFIQLRVEVRPGVQSLGVLVAHFKSGFDDDDLVRRQIEAVRLSQAATAYLANYPDDGLVVMGDFNEGVIDCNRCGDSVSQAAFDAANGATSFSLGDDLAFPFTYDPIATLGSGPLLRTEPTWEDTSNQYATRIPSGRRIDYIYYAAPAILVEDQVYNPCYDDGVDAPPIGLDYMDLTGPELVSGCAIDDDEIVSDHRPVVADLRLSD